MMIQMTCEVVFLSMEAKIGVYQDIKHLIHVMYFWTRPASLPTWFRSVNECRRTNSRAKQPRFGLETYVNIYEILLMAEILHQLIGSSPHYLQGFIHRRWLFGISEPSTVRDDNTCLSSMEGAESKSSRTMATLLGYWNLLVVGVDG